VIRFEVDPASRTRVAWFEGVVDDAELLGSYGALVQEPDYDSTLDDLVDMTGVDRLDVSSESVRQLVRMFTPLDPEGLVTRLAIVAPRDHVFGMARMYEILRSDAPEEICVFRDRAAAERWLRGGGV
jgi:hypothetical protein